MPTSHFGLYNHRFTKALVSALFLFFLAFPLPSRAQFGGPFDPGIFYNTLQINVGDTVKNTAQKIWDLLKEHSGLLWKQTQVYFGTRLAQDAAIYLASGGKGQSSFIWNVSEIKKLANATAGEYLDNLSKSYFGKSACQPGDLRTMVQIDLSARGLITGISNVRTRVCEEICQRTAVPELDTATGKVGPNPDATGGERTGDLTQSGLLNDLAGMSPVTDFHDEFNKIKKDLDGYANSAKDLMKEIVKVQNETRLGVGKYVWENVLYTLDVLSELEDPTIPSQGSKDRVIINAAHPAHLIINGNDITFSDQSVFDNFMSTYKTGQSFQSYFKDALAGGVEFKYVIERHITGQEPAPDTINYENADFKVDGHGPNFAGLVINIFNAFYVAHPEAKEPNPYPWSMKDIDNFFHGNSVTAGLGLEALAKGASAVVDTLVATPITAVTGQKGASLISFTFQSKYVSNDERKLLLGDMFLELYQPEMGNIYSLFRANEEAIKRKALLARSPNIPEIPEVIDILDPDLDIRSFTKDDPFQKADDYVKFVAENNKSKVYKSMQDIPVFPNSDYATTDDLTTIVLNSFIKMKNGYENIDSLSASVVALSANKQIINSKYPDLKKFTEAFQKFNQCVQACESAKLKEPKGTCTLDKITNGPGALGVTGLTGGVQVNVEGSQVYSAYSSEAIGKGDEGHQEEMDARDARAEKNLPDFASTKRKRWLATDLQALSQIGFPDQNPLGQILDIALQTQGQSEEARRQAEVEAQAKDFKPKKSLISGDVKVTSDMNAGRLNNALADVRAANNEYTDSVLAQMWGVFFNTLLEEFQKKLYDKGLDPKLYGGAFNPITRQAFGKGVAAAEKQLGQVFKPNITPGGVITTQILTNLTSGCEKPASKKRFDECIIDENFKQAIEQRLTLAKATCYQSGNKECSSYISLNSAFGYVSADGTEPQIQYGAGGAADSGQGIPYKSMIVLRKYRIIPSSWEIAATWIKEYALKSRDKKPAPGKVTLKDVMDGFDDKTSAYYGLVNPNWVLKLPQYQCNRQGAGEEIITETPSENPGATNSDPFDVQITRADSYCADPISCIREKPDGTGCAEFGYCTVERDFWRFPSTTCQEINKTCQAYTAPNGKTAAYLEQSLDINGECSESSDGCTGFIRDYNYGRFVGEIGSRGDGKSDTAFTFSPNRASDAVNATGLVEVVPAAFQCESLGRTCTYEQIAGRADGCALPNTNGVQCAPPSNIITNVSKNQRYWCGLPGGAGCFVGKTAVIQGSGFEYREVGGDISLDKAIAAGHSTVTAGTKCVVGSWQYKDSTLIFKAAPADSTDTPAPLTCSLYRSSEASQVGTKRVYLNDNARACPASAAGCEQYYMVDFARDEYTRNKQQRFLNLEEKKKFTENLLSAGKAYFDKLLPPQKASFDYSQISISEITPASVVGAEFAKPPKIVPVQLNSNRVSCTEREVLCRRYTAKGGGTVAAIINPRANQCPNECAGFERYSEPLTVIEKKLGGRAVPTDPPFSTSPLNRYLIPGSGFECSSVDAGCEKFIKSDNEPDVIRMYLKDIRLCVNPDHKKDDGSKANAVYTIIESSATGATRPVNVELLQSTLKDKIYYIYHTTDNQGKKRVKVFNTDKGHDGVAPLYENYNGPCVFMNPDQNQDRPVDRWQCNDIFDGINGIKQHLERCLILNDDGKPVTDLTNSDCREYIYFSPGGGGAERYPLPSDAPIYASPTSTCDVLKRGSPDGLAYPIDPQSPILSRFSCSEATVSCREYQGPGFQTNGALSLDFEGSETRWVSGGIPEKALNVNGEEDEAIVFKAGDADKIYYFDILSIPKDVSTAEIFDGKSFIASFWGKKDGSGSPTLALAACGYNDEGAFTSCSKEKETPFASLSLTNDWRSHRSAQVTPDGFVPTHFIITVPANSSLALDNIVLETSTSVYLLRNSIEPAGEDGWNTPKSCNTDFNQNTPLYYAPITNTHPQLGCRAYTSDRDEPVAFKSYGLCRDEAVGCTAVINTFNTVSPKGESFVPRGETLTDEERPKNTYLTPPDVLEYVVVPSDPNSSVFCKRESARGGSAFGGEVGCTLLGKETRDQTGKVIGFTETARIDDPGLYAQGASSIACLVSENSCRLYKRNENESPARFKDPGNSACEWLTDGQSQTKKKGWFRKIVDADGNITDDYEVCELSYEMLDSSIDYKIPRAKGYCVEKSTGRSVLNPVGSGYYPTAWCDTSLIGKNLVTEERDATTADNNKIHEDNAANGSNNPDVAQHTNSLQTCLDYIDVNTDEGAIKDNSKINAGIVEDQVVCAQTPMSCDPKESKCTWYKDPLASGLGRHYFQIKTDEVNEGDCEGKVSDDAGCRLFEDTSVKEKPKLQYNAKMGRDGGTKDAAMICQNTADDDKNADNPDNPNDCDTNQLIEVERDRACGEWLACSSAIVTGKENETVCVERKPCNIAGGGECVNFVQNAKQSFESKELSDKSARDRVSRLSGYSNEGYRWSICNMGGENIASGKEGVSCQRGVECAKEEKLFIQYKDNKPDKSVTCASAGDTWDDYPAHLSTNTCVNNICEQGVYKGQSCTKSQECFSDDELFIPEQDGSEIVCSEKVSFLCQNHPTVSKPGFKPFDEIAEVGGHADVVNGDFEEVFVDMASVQNQNANTQLQQGADSVKLFPAGWEIEKCGSNGNSCKIVRRFNPATMSGTRSELVRNGKYSLQIGAPEAFATQFIENIIPGATYTLSAWINVTAGDSGTLMSGVGIQERDAGNVWQVDPAGTACNTNFKSPQNYCIGSKGTDGWEYFTTAFTTTASTRQIEITLINRGGGGVLFDDIQLRAHLQVSPEKAIAPSCRLYPESDSLNCDARDKQGNRIRGWRGYCIENDPRADTSDPRSTTQCLNWWPTDIIQGETNVLGHIEDAGYKGQAPLYYCAESMDKDPGVPLPRLVCLARNDPKDLRFEACKVIALVSDPKPKFYTLQTSDWRIGTDPLNFGTGSDNEIGGHLEKVVNSDKWNAGVIAFDNTGNRMTGCLLVQGLGGWEEKKANKGMQAFLDIASQEGGKNYGGCTWSSGGVSSWQKCASDIEQYYHKVAVFVYSDHDGTINLGTEEDGCQSKDQPLYALTDYGSGYYHKSADPYSYDSYPVQDNDIAETPAQRQKRIDDAKQAENMARVSYYTFDGFNLIFGDTLNSNTEIKKTNEKKILLFSGSSIFVPRQSRPQQCRMIVQAVDEAGRNKMWSEKIDKGVGTLPIPLDYTREAPLCSPYGATPPFYTPDDIVVQPIDPKTSQPTGGVLRVPLELYNQENPEDNDRNLICKEAHRGEGFYACGGICNVCVGGSTPGKLCLNDDECGDSGSCGTQKYFPDSEKGICAGKGTAWEPSVPPRLCTSSAECRELKGQCQGGPKAGQSCDPQKNDKDNNNEDCKVADQTGKCRGTDYCRKQGDLENPFDLHSVSHITRNEPGINAIARSGLRRLQQIFAKIYKVWEWKEEPLDPSKQRSRSKSTIPRGSYVELKEDQLNAHLNENLQGANFTWNEARDISNLAKSCARSGVDGNIYINAQLCAESPGCKQIGTITASDGCIPNNPYMDYDYCATLGAKCPVSVTANNLCTTTFARCVPAQNQYPNVKNISVNGNNDPGDVVTLAEGQRTVKLDFDITLNPNQKPIKTVMVDWGDGSQTALSGLAWDAGHKTFSHTYVFYPETFSERPAGCKKYQTTNGVYECRYRPRVKVVDNWGWCNGAKLVKANGAHLERGQAYVPTEVVSEAVNTNNTPEEDGYSWGYYGGDCFKPYSVTLGANGNPEVANNSGDNAVYSMQSWDYFPGVVRVVE